MQTSANTIRTHPVTDVARKHIAVKTLVIWSARAEIKLLHRLQPDTE